MLTVLCGLFDGGEQVPAASRCFSSVWVEKLYRGVKRNLTLPFRFVCLTHYPCDVFREPVEVVPFLDDNRKWTCLMECFRPDVVGERNMLLGLDTIVRGSLDDLANLSVSIAMCRDRYGKTCRYNNAVTLYGPGTAAWLWSAWKDDVGRWEAECRVVGQPSEMAFINRILEKTETVPLLLEDLVPAQVVCYRGSDRAALEKARLVWFYAQPKCDRVGERFLQEAWV